MVLCISGSAGDGRVAVEQRFAAAAHKKGTGFTDWRKRKVAKSVHFDA